MTMHISDTIAALFTAIGFAERATRGGREFSGRIIGAAMAGQLAPDGGRILTFTLDHSGRWLAMIDGWGMVQADTDLRLHHDRPAGAIEAISGAAWPAIRAAIEAARGESARQSDMAGMAAALAKGKRKARFDQWAHDHLANALAIDRALNGEGEALTDDELAAALSDELAPLP
jgi:hypothetical protein